MPRPKGSKNKAPVTTKTIAVRLTDAEQRALRTVAASPSKAIKALIARLRQVSGREALAPLDRPLDR